MRFFQKRAKTVDWIKVYDSAFIGLGLKMGEIKDDDWRKERSGQVERICKAIFRNVCAPFLDEDFFGYLKLVYCMECKGFNGWKRR